MVDIVTIADGDTNWGDTMRSNLNLLASAINQANTLIGAKYTLPSGGIPATDLASAVRSQLTLAASAYQKPSGGIPDTDLTSGVRAALTKANASVQTVNGYAPDASGNVVVSGGGSGGGAVNSVNGMTGDVVLGKSQVGLGNVDNTADADKPVSTATASALAGKYTKPTQGIPSSDFTSTVQTSLGKADTAVQPSALSAYVKSVNGSVPDANGNVTVAGGGSGVSSVNGRTGDVTLAKSDVGLTNVDNTSDANKPVSTAQATAIGAKYTKPSTGIPSSDLDSSTQSAITKAGTSVQTVNGVTPNASGAVTVAATVPNYDSVQELQYVAYGHSFGQQQGYWNTTAAGTYPNRVRDILNTDVNTFANRTVSGQRAAAMATTVQNTYRRGDYGIVTMMIVQNDAGYRTDATAFKASLQQAIDWIRGPGEFAPTIVLVLDTYSTQAGYNRYPTPLTDAVIDQYNQYVKDVVALYPSDGSVITADANTGWDRNTMTAPDGQHPNDRGSAFIANAIAKALVGKAYREGQNVGFTQPTYIYDSYNRPDNTNIKGSMYGNSYTTYAAQAAATFGVIDGKAYRSSTSDTTSEAIAVLDSGTASVDISAVMSVITTKGMGIAWRASDINNYWCLDVRTGQNPIVYQKVSGGAFAAIGSPFSIAVNNGDTVRITHNNAGTIRGYVNGVQAFSGTNNALNTNTKHGIRITEAPGSASRIDDLIIK